MPTALCVAYAMMLGTTTARPCRMRPSAVSSAGNGTVARSRCSLSKGQKAGLATSSVKSGLVGGWSFTPVRIRALAPVSGSRRQRSRTGVQAPPGGQVRHAGLKVSLVELNRSHARSLSRSWPRLIAKGRSGH